MADVELFIFIGTACFTSACVASAVTYRAVHWSRDRDLEVIAERKDVAVEAAFDTAFELQRLSGESDVIDVEPFMADSQRCVWCLQPRHAGECNPGDMPDVVIAERPCSECGTAAAFCAQLALSETGLAGCCGPCATTGTTHPALLDPQLIHLVAERTALNDWADRIHVDDDSAGSLPRSLPGNGGNR